MEAEKEEGANVYRQLHRGMKSKAKNERPTWKEISDFILPEHGRYLSDQSTQVDQNKKNRSSLLNSVPCDAAEKCGAAIHSGLTSPSRPWFRLTLANKELMESGPVKIWCQTVRDLMLSVLSRSNYYETVHATQIEAPTFGTSAMFILEDKETVIRCRALTIGEYFISCDSTGRVDSLSRKYELNARQMVQQFGKNNVSEQVWARYEANDVESVFPIINVIRPNADRDLKRADRKGMAFESVHVEESGDEKKVLKRSGFKSKPFSVARWSVIGSDSWGVGLGHKVLPESKQLQLMERDKLELFDKTVRPPMNADSSLKDRGATIISSGVNFVDMQSGNSKGMAPVFQPQANLRDWEAAISRQEDKVRTLFLNDLFASVLGEDKTMTAYEVAERHAEKLAFIAPNTERLLSEKFDTELTRVYNIMEDADMIPPPPPEMAGHEVELEYISDLVQAQKAAQIQPIQRVIGSVIQIAQAVPSVLHKIDFDEAVDQMADMEGLPSKLVRADNEVAKIRAEEQKQQQLMQMQQQAMAAAQGAKDLSQAKLGQGTALDTVAKSLGG